MLYRGEWQGVCSNNVLSPLITAFQVVLLENPVCLENKMFRQFEIWNKKKLNIFEN